MARSVPYRVECSLKCRQAQNDALDSTFFILRQTGPTGFTIKDEHDERTYKIFLGDQHQCTCSTFQRNQDLFLWQRGLVEREINELLRGLSSDEEERRKFYRRHRAKSGDGTNVNNEVDQRPIGENDICPICQEEFFAKQMPTTYCRRGCGNNVHVKCMKIWLDHQVTTGEKIIKCPLCRGIFGTSEHLKTIEEQHMEKSSVHLGFSCHRCRTCPITGNCYKCTTCEDYFLCQTCFNMNIHNEHSFDYREKSFQRWRIAAREHLMALPNALHQILANRDMNENNYEALLQLENAQNTVIGSIPENIVRSIPTERVHEQSRLMEPNEQCRLCLRAYQIGERVRRLPCQHRFHIDCIDGWLLHSHPTCPIDGHVIWNAEGRNEKKETKRPSTSLSRTRSQNGSPSSNPSVLPINMGLTVVPYQMRTRTNTDLNERFRRLHVRAPLRFLLSSSHLPFQTNIRTVRSRPSTRMMSTSLEQSRHRTNNEFDHEWAMSISNFNYRPYGQRCSSAQ
ncbi:unnamed protein product [Adineta ricciae]|uniref:Uncharacterized protein n=1 Tax=Adineta ricciae TaxID=249248 RepID=A0A814ETT4_ADIRI|nr:unnamed protein product [Adineta ricciae]